MPARPRISLALLLGLVIALMIPSVAMAQPRAIMAANTDERTPSRAWAAYQGSDGEHLLVYLAPRDETPGGQRGQIQGVRTLGPRLPSAMAALGERVYLAFPPVVRDGRRLIRIYSLQALPSPVGGLWMLDPPDQFKAHAPIETRDALLGLTATSGDLWALLKGDDGLSLARLTGSGWQITPVPDEIPDRRVELRSIGPDPVLIDRSAIRFRAHRFDRQNTRWDPLGHELSVGLDARILSAPNALRVIDHPRQGDPARLRHWSDDGVFQILDALPVPADAALALLPDRHTLLALRVAKPAEPVVSDDGAPSVGEPSVMLMELSTRDGSVLFDDPPRVSAPVSPEEFRFLVVMMVLIMVGVLVVVILPDRTDAMVMPEGVVLGEPGRRLMASVLDAMAVCVIVGSIAGIPATDILTLTVIMQPGNAWGIFPITILAGIAYSTSAESILGATPGKMLMGLRLVAAQQGAARRVPFPRVLARNIIKWALPPVAALALVDPEGLHRADRATRSLVVSPRPAGPEDATERRGEDEDAEP